MSKVLDGYVTTLSAAAKFVEEAYQKLNDESAEQVSFSKEMKTLLIEQREAAVTMRKRLADSLLTRKELEAGFTETAQAVYSKEQELRKSSDALVQAVEKACLISGFKSVAQLGMALYPVGGSAMAALSVAGAAKSVLQSTPEPQMSKAIIPEEMFSLEETART